MGDVQRFRPVIAAAAFSARAVRWLRLPGIAGAAFTAKAAWLWGLALTGARGKSTPAMLCVEVGGAVAATGVAALCWTMFRQRRIVDDRFERQAAEYRRREEMQAAEYRRKEAVLISAFKLLSGGNPTGPMPALRAVAGETRDPRSRRG